MSIDIGVSNLARVGEKGWVGVNNLARQIDKGWIGDENGKARLFFSSYTNKLIAVYSSTSGQKLLSTEDGANVESVIYDTTVNSSNYGAPTKQICGAQVQITQGVFGNEMYLFLIETGTDGTFSILKTIAGTDYKIIDVSSFAKPSSTSNYAIPVLTFVNGAFYMALRCSSGIRIVRSYDGEAWTELSVNTKAYTNDTTTTATIGTRFPVTLLYGTYSGRTLWVLPTVNSSNAVRVYYSTDLLEWHCDADDSTYDVTNMWVWGIDANSNVYRVQAKKIINMSATAPTEWTHSTNVGSPIFVGKHPTKNNIMVLSCHDNVSEIDTTNKTVTKIFTYTTDVSNQIQANKFKIVNSKNSDYTKLIGLVYSKVGYSNDGASWTFVSLDDNKALYSAYLNVAVAYD